MNDWLIALLITFAILLFYILYFSILKFILKGGKNYNQ